MVDVALRSIEEADLDALFDQMRDPESVRMAAFTAKDPDDRTAFDTHMSKLRTSPGITLRAVTCDGRFVGSISSFVMDGDTEITYWIDRSAWGRGVAGRALALFLDTVTVRPLHARVASDNLGSLRVLHKGRLQDHRHRDLLRTRPERRNRGNHPAPRPAVSRSSAPTAGVSSTTAAPHGRVTMLD